MRSGEEEQRRKGINSSPPSPNPEWRFNQTLRNVQGLLKGRSFPGKVLLTRKSEPECVSPGHTPDYDRSYSENDIDQYEYAGSSLKGEVQSSSNTTNDTKIHKSDVPKMNTEGASPDAQKSVSGARATDSARITKFTKELSRPAVILDFRGRFCSQYLGKFDIQGTQRATQRPLHSITSGRW